MHLTIEDLSIIKKKKVMDALNYCLKTYDKKQDNLIKILVWQFGLIFLFSIKCYHNQRKVYNNANFNFMKKIT